MPRHPWQPDLDAVVPTTPPLPAHNHQPSDPRPEDLPGAGAYPARTPTPREVFRRHHDLFDGETGRRLCMHDLVSDLREGRRFTVTDASTGRDLTLDTLLQAVSLGLDRLDTWLERIQQSMFTSHRNNPCCPTEASGTPPTCPSAPEPCQARTMPVHRLLAGFSRVGERHRPGAGT
ncbi:hypothetical protein [Streptomyces sp. NPDC005865]|uniref:hypothetical protein n=1 Tax=Streptomyces sp. NPDC005865 TaxID=3155453 RepID=UPI0033C3D3B0